MSSTIPAHVDRRGPDAHDSARRWRKDDRRSSAIPHLKKGANERKNARALLCLDYSESLMAKQRTVKHQNPSASTCLWRQEWQ